MVTEKVGGTTIKVDDKTIKDVAERAALLRVSGKSDSVIQKMETIKSWHDVSESEMLFIIAWLIAWHVAYPNTGDQEESMLTMLALGQVGGEMCEHWRTQTKPN